VRNPTSQTEFPAAAIFGKRFLQKTSAWTWRQQNRTLMILGMFFQMLFSGAFFRNLGVPYEKPRQ
jgi:hypothetical protein